MSKATIIRQAILGVILVVFIVLLAWEFVVARPGYTGAVSHLENLQSRYLEASNEELNGGPEGADFNTDFTSEGIEARIGSAAGAEPKGDGAELRHYVWRRGNMVQTYQLWVLYTARGPNKDTWVFTDLYTDETEIPASVANFVEPENTVALPTEGPIGVSVGLGSGEPRRNRPPSNDGETGDGETQGNDGEDGSGESSDDQ